MSAESFSQVAACLRGFVEWGRSLFFIHSLVPLFAEELWLSAVPLHQWKPWSLSADSTKVASHDKPKHGFRSLPSANTSTSSSSTIQDKVLCFVTQECTGCRGVQERAPGSATWFVKLWTEARTLSWFRNSEFWSFGTSLPDCHSVRCTDCMLLVLSAWCRHSTGTTPWMTTSTRSIASSWLTSTRRGSVCSCSTFT